MRLLRGAFTIVSTIALGLSVVVAPVAADPADVFPSGPYTATLISTKILYPSLFGVVHRVRLGLQMSPEKHYVGQ